MTNPILHSPRVVLCHALDVSYGILKLVRQEFLPPYDIDAHAVVVEDVALFPQLEELDPCEFQQAVHLVLGPIEVVYRERIHCDVRYGESQEEVEQLRVHTHTQFEREQVNGWVDEHSKVRRRLNRKGGITRWTGALSSSATGTHTFERLEALLMSSDDLYSLHPRCPTVAVHDEGDVLWQWA